MTDRPGSQDKTNAPGWDKASWDGNSPEPGSRDGMQRRAPPPVEDNSLNRFLGGSPLSVLIRLLIVSLVVGALLMWLDIQPLDIYYGLRRFFHRIWMLGFESIHEISRYILAGAVIVVPIWFILRLMNSRGK